MKNVTIKDVAKAAGVSPSTVSNVVNGLAKCSEETKFRILQTMEELKYKPNLNAKALVKKKSNLIGVILPRYDKGYGESEAVGERHFIQNILSGMQNALIESEDYDILVTEASDIMTMAEWISKRSLDAVILLGMFSGGIISKIQSLEVPVILVDNYHDEIKGAVYIKSEDTFGGYLAAEHLLKNGIRDLAIATGNLEENELFKRRLYGCLSAFEDYGFNFNKKNIFEESEISFSGGKKLGYRIMNSKKYDGIIVLSDILALGVLRVLNEKQIKVPEEISLIGFDNIPACEYTFPQLSSIDQRAYRKGKTAVQTALKIIENKGVTVDTDISIPVKLIQREST